MPSLHEFSAVTILSGVVAFIYVLLRAFRHVKARVLGKLPPGPIGFPIVGLLPFVARFPELVLHKWANEFGPLFSMRLGNQLFVVVSDPQVVKDLIVTNGAIFSSRKEMFMKCEIIFARRGITAMPYNDAWRKHRRLAALFLTAKAVSEYKPNLEFEVREMLRALYSQGRAGAVPVNPQAHLSRVSLNNILTIVFGTRTDSVDDPLVAHWLMLSREFMNYTGPVANWVDFIPFLRNVPYLPIVSRGKHLHQGLVDTCSSLINDVDRRMKAGEDVPDCMAKYLLRVREEQQLDMLDIVFLCCAFMIGGVETTAAVKQWFAAHIPAFPLVQARAQAELDRVVGRDRLPQAEDEKDLPYVRAIVKEIERVHNPFWLGTPHLSTEDFHYRGHIIPKNTGVIVNTYTMHNNSRRYPNPQEFNPDRYLTDHHSSAESANLADPYKRDHWMYGAGRRICPGITLAEQEIFLAVAGLLWAFDMQELPSEPIDLHEYDGLSGRSPLPFRVKMVPRHESVAEVLGTADIPCDVGVA
ncbi:cytochrome P450 [Phanerochaete sordida]|uniref:Cytochrome P450 n=1 Tax=Phanerochaete sordida TaxID=48140 RepID=A0A9P3LFD8_9APHY|nr:cytochrome P450 [Phanerochaete sordida]